MLMFRLLCFLGLLFSTFAEYISYNKDDNKLRLLYDWPLIEYLYPSEAIRQAAAANGQFVSGNSLPIDVDVHYRCQQEYSYSGSRKNTVFITIPRFLTGIPITLGIVSQISGRNGPLIEAYPNYAMQSNVQGSCDGLTSVFRVKIDECNRLWVLDAGRIGSNQVCPPQLLAFNLHTDELIHRYRIPAGQFKSGESLLVTPEVDVRDPYGSCMDTNVYMADSTGIGLIVYSMSLGRSWRVTNKLFFPNPDFGTFSIAGETFDLMAGCFGLALTPRTPIVRNHLFSSFENRYLLFHALSSNTENYVSTAVLNNGTAWTNKILNPKAFKIFGRRPTQSAAEAIDRNGNLFFGLMDPIAIACWNMYRPYNPDKLNLISVNYESLQFASGVKVVNNCAGKQELFVLTNRFQEYTENTLNNRTDNYRVVAASIDSLVPSGIC